MAESARLLETERDRVRRMENLFLRFESDTLHSQLVQANEQLLKYTQGDSETLVQLNEACQEIDHLESQVQSSASEIEKLKVHPLLVDFFQLISRLNSHRTRSQR